MKEQHPYNITPEQGWAKMKPVLDEAMPEGKPARRNLFFWWVASAVIVAGLLGVLIIDHKAKESESASLGNETMSSPVHANQKETTNQSATTHELQANEINENTSSPTELESEINNQSENTPSASQKVNSITPSKSEVKTKKAIPMAALKEQSASENVIAVNASDLSSEANQTMITDQDLVTETTSDITPDVMRSTVQVAQPLITLPVGPVVSENQDAAPHWNTTAKRKRVPTLLSPTLAVSTLFGQTGGFGVYGGAGVDLNISRKFSLTSAIGYSSYNPNAGLGFARSKDVYFEQNPIVVFDPSNEGLNNYVYSESINAKTDYNSIKPIIKTISQWQLDIGLNWRFSRRLYASGGAKFGFHTEAVSQYPIVSGDPSGIPTIPGAELGNSLNDFNVIRESNTAVFIGLGYRLGKHFDIFANWTHGLNQYVLNDEGFPSADLSTGDRTDYIRGLSLGLKYSL